MDSRGLRASRTRLASMVPLFLSALVYAGCSDQGAEPDPPLDPFVERQIAADVRADAEAVARANNQFALELYAEVREVPTNLVLSPYSIYEALAMTAAGAAGTTETEMANVLHWDGDRLVFHDACGALLRSLNRGSQLGGYSLYIANRLWGQKGYGFLDEFLTLTGERHLAPLQELDFAADPELCRETINAWVEEATRDRIVDLLPAGTIDTLTRLVLTNAIWFKGTWLTKFDRDLTASAPFYVTPDRSVTVDMMQADGDFHAGFHDGVQVLQLPYEGEDLSMLLLLPAARSGLEELEARLDVDLLEAFVASLDEHEIEVFLPRFEFETELALVPVLTELGMPSAFGATADFSRMNGQRNLAITEVRHKAYIRVDEEGTEAAAATAVVIGETSLPPVFRADRPFLFLIQDHVTGAILFLGRVVDPS
jgi:serpin B